MVVRMDEWYCGVCKQVTYWLDGECYYCGNKVKGDEK